MSTGPTNCLSLGLGTSQTSGQGSGSVHGASGDRTPREPIQKRATPTTMLMDSETRDAIWAGALHWDNPTQHKGIHPRHMTPNVDTGGPEFPPHHSMETAHGARLMPPQGSRQPMKTRRLAGPGAGLVPGLGDISSDGLGVTGRVCDAASPHGCRHASPEHPGMPGDSDTCATNIEYCPSLETRRYPTHSAQACPRHQDGAAGSQGPRSRRDPPRCHYLGQPCPVGPVFGRDVHAGGRTGPGTTW